MIKRAMVALCLHPRHRPTAHASVMSRFTIASPSGVPSERRVAQHALFVQRPELGEALRRGQRVQFRQRLGFKLEVEDTCSGSMHVRCCKRSAQPGSTRVGWTGPIHPEE